MLRVFVSYSHRDEALRAELDKHLSLLKRQGELDLWSDQRIVAGQPLDGTINDALERSDVILLLLSADFMASDYCYGVEMQRAMERHDAGEAVVVPVILRPCDFHTAPFGRLKAVPTDGRAVTKWPNQDDAFLDIVRHLRHVLAEKRADSTPRPQATAASKREPGVVDQQKLRRVVRSSNVSLPRRFSDQDRHDFSQGTFDYIRQYFEGSLRELQERNDGVQSRMTLLSPRAFTVVIFRDGQRIAGCHIRIGGVFGGDGIAYSNSENAAPNSCNEQLMIEQDQHALFLRPTMASFERSDAKLSQEGAAEHLWSMLIAPLQQR